VLADWDHNMRWFFSKKLSNRYIDVIISEYGDGGYSSVSIDSEFQKLKRINFLRYAHKQLPFHLKLKWIREEFYLARKRGKILDVVNVIYHLRYVFSF
jgi:hypothetical protein